MTNTDVDTGAKKKREAKAEHTFVGADGNVVDNQNEATGIGYKNLETGKVFIYQIPGAVAGSELAMLAVLGAKTKATNTASGVRNDKNDPGSPADEDEAIADWFGELKPGTWPQDRGGGARAIDIDLLVEAMTVVFKREKQAFDPDKYKAKLTSDEAYRKQVFSLDAVKAQYLIARAARAGKGVAGILLAD